MDVKKKDIYWRSVLAEGTCALSNYGALYGQICRSAN